MPSQDTLVSNPNRKNFRSPGAFAKAFLLGAFFSAGIGAADPPSLLPLSEPGYDSLLVRALDTLNRGAYTAADSLLRSLPDIPARGFFRGLGLAARCNDLGDTAALTAAEAEWERLARAGDERDSPLAHTANYGIYRGLAEMQMSYVASLHGSRLQAARLGRRAAKHLESHARIAEAEAALALYDYYKAELLQGIDWLPFVKADRAGPLRRVEAAVSRSRYLHATLSASLLWIYYDSGRYAEGMPAIRGFLARYPGNRVWRQMLADFHFRGAKSGAGDLDSALALHLALASEYQSLASAYPPPAYLPLGYLCSVGNLAKIYAAQGKRDLLERQLEIWYAPRYAGLSPWLPASLVREVDGLRKENMLRK